VQRCAGRFSFGRSDAALRRKIGQPEDFLQVSCENRGSPSSLHDVNRLAHEPSTQRVIMKKTFAAIASAIVLTALPLSAMQRADAVRRSGRRRGNQGDVCGDEGARDDDRT
jgi:hypothetical protein